MFDRNKFNFLFAVHNNSYTILRIYKQSSERSFKNDCVCVCYHAKWILVFYILLYFNVISCMATTQKNVVIINGILSLYYYNIN